MTMRSVGFQLKTEGKAQVRNDFAEVKADGVASVTAIGQAAETSAAKAAKAVDDLTDRQIATYRRQANAAKMAAAGAANQDAFNAALATPTSQQFATVNTDRSTGAARRSADVFEAAARDEAAAAAVAAEAERSAARAADDRAASIAKLRAAIDPLSVAQQRFAAETQAADSLLASGAIGTAEHASALAIYRQRLDDTRRSLDGTARSEADASAGAARLLAEMNPVGAAQDRLNRELAEYQDWARRGLLSTEQLTTAQVAARKRFDDTTDAIKRQSGAGGGLSKNQKQTLIYTASDIIGSSANGFNPQQLIMQQGPQVLQAFAAEEGGLLKLRALINPVTVGLAGLTAAVAIGATAWLDHANALQKANALSLGSGRALGLTGAALEANAIAAAKAEDMTVSAAREIELAYVETGKITGDVLAGLTAMTKDFAAATGTDAKSAATTLGAAFADPIAGAEDLAVKYGVVNQTTADYIAKLVEQNDMTGAQRVLLEALQPAFDGAADHANVLARGWDNIKVAASSAWEWMGKAIDRMVTGGATADKIRDLQAQRERGPTVGQLLTGTSVAEYQAGIDRQISKLRSDAQQETARIDRDRSVAARAAGQQVVDRYTGADQLGAYQSAAGKLRAALKTDMPPDDRAQITQTLSAYTHAIDTFIPKQEKANQLAAIDAKIAATKSPSAKAALATERSRVEMSGQVIDSASAEAQAISRGDRARSQATTGSNRHAQTLAREAQSMEVNAAAALEVADAYLKSSAAGMIAEARRKASTDATRKGIDVDAQMRRQLNLQISDGVATATKTIAAMRDETVARTAVNDNVAAGTLTVEQMNQALSDEAALRPLLAAATVAQGQGMTAAYDSIMRAVTAYRAALADAHAEEARSGASTAISASRRNVAELRASILGMSGTPLQQSISAARRAAEQEADAQRYVDGPKGNDRTDFINSKVDEARAAYAQSQASFILDTVRGQQDSVKLSERELELAGANDNTREGELEKLRLALQIRRQFPDMAAADVAQILAGVDAQQAVNEKLKITAAAIDEVRGYGGQFVDEVLSEDTWSSWGNAGKTVLNSLKSEFIKLALLNPLKNLLNGNSNLPTITSAFGSIGKLFGGSAAVTASTIGPPGNATGNESFSGGLTYVNENGGEIMDLPTGTRIYPAAESRRMMQATSNGGTRGGDTHNHFSGNLLTPEWWQQIQAGNANAAMQGAAGGAAMSEAEGQRRSARRLGRSW